MRFRFFALAASIVAISGCADSSQLPAAPAEASFSANPGSNGVVQSVSGNADVIHDAGLRRLGVQARRSADGTVTGKVTVRQEWEGGLELDLDVQCFTIVDNRAYVGMVLTAVDGVPLTTYVAYGLRLHDNGEGQKAAPDQATKLLDLNPAFPQPQTFCNNANRTDQAYDLVRGNVNVRP